MGRKTAGETMAHLLVAFLQEGTWSQAALQRLCGVGARAIRTRLLDLQAAGVRLEREEDHPHVYWSVEPGWLQGLGLVDNVPSADIARLIARLPRSNQREKVLSRLLPKAFGLPSAPNSTTAGVSDEVLSVLEDGAARQVPIVLGYFSASRGDDAIRTVSVQRIVYGDRVRFVAYCHTSSALKWFRADRVRSPRLEPTLTFLASDVSVVNDLIAASLDGFAGGEGAKRCEFFVRSSEARWALRSFPAGAEPAVCHERSGAHVTVSTSAIEVLARYLVGLGGNVTVLGPDELRKRVRTLARESLAANTRLNAPAVRSIRASK